LYQKFGKWQRESRYIYGSFFLEEAGDVPMVLEKSFKKIPELLIPCGGMDRLGAALSYGADAVYVGGQKFGLRAGADNFTNFELEEACGWVHQQQKKIYVVLNAFLYDDELQQLPNYVKWLEKIGIDAVIVSDLGAINVIRSCTSLPIHLSTQASCLNVQAAIFWKKMGVKRIVLGREVTIQEASDIKKQSGLEVEMFIHGSMCMSYSGHCTISNFTCGRDSNRGGCAHSCRFDYHLYKKGEEKGEEDRTFSHQSSFMSSKDLVGIDQIELFIEAGIDSLKVEGRMKGMAYVAQVTKSYRQVLSLYHPEKPFIGHDQETREIKNHAKHILESYATRGSCSGSLETKAGEDSISLHERERSHKPCVGKILAPWKNGLLIDVKYAFTMQNDLEVLPFKTHSFILKNISLKNMNHDSLEKAKPSTTVYVELEEQERSYLSSLSGGEAVYVA
jgi:putative protease